MEPESPLPHSPVPILSQINPVHVSPFHILKIHFNIILSSMPMSSKWSLSFKYPPSEPCVHLSAPVRATCLAPSLLPDLVTRKIFGDQHSSLRAGTLRMVTVCTTQFNI